VTVNMVDCSLYRRTRGPRRLAWFTGVLPWGRDTCHSIRYPQIQKLEKAFQRLKMPMSPFYVKFLLFVI